MENLEGKVKKDLVEVEQARKELIEEDPDLKALFDHPLNAIKVTPELLENPTFQGIQSLIYDGTPEEIAQNFLNHGKESLLQSHESTGEKAAVKLVDAMN